MRVASISPASRRSPAAVNSLQDDHFGVFLNSVSAESVKFLVYKAGIRRVRYDSFNWLGRLGFLNAFGVITTVVNKNVVL